ncbi:NAD(P)-binding domain-containing protein [Noviherbaspirillum saxi]|uniref:NAD(P)/FAD-dependent oxidoreductase n=1 Tax=Noviherbaspirillum saxi TaxID=2320863 RepID=A0A3A3FQB0_9BURK|nr:NAD(P)-binding domain-containing protein [Noviherbaspirillum saxi]RJF95889.1 NAD(P)/FAD-dependent oxidoreductase [Noviherbaspirillum saxi]
MNGKVDVTIIGAGPYGLSIAAHLRKLNVDFRILGRPMHSWLVNMPKDMLLKSAGFASNLYDPDRAFPLRRYCEEHHVPYGDIDFPIPLEAFCSYGKAFQERFVPNLEDEDVAALTQVDGGFDVRLNYGKVFRTQKIIVAVGLDYFRHIPKELASLPKEFLSHSADHHDLVKFKGKEVVVIGSGAAGTDIAVLLHENQTKVHLVARQRSMNFGAPWDNSAQPFLHRLRNPISGIGPGMRGKIWSDAPWLYRFFSDDFRIMTAKTFLGPSGGWFMKERARGLDVFLGFTVASSTVSEGRVRLDLIKHDGSTNQLSGNHVISATGYIVDVKHIPFLNSSIVEKLRLVGKAPRLSCHFESSVPGLYFVGPISATSFGPVMRFMVGADFTSRKISKHLAALCNTRKWWRSGSLETSGTG